MRSRCLWSNQIHRSCTQGFASDTKALNSFWRLRDIGYRSKWSCNATHDHEIHQGSDVRVRDTSGDTEALIRMNCRPWEMMHWTNPEQEGLLTLNSKVKYHSSLHNVEHIFLTHYHRSVSLHVTDRLSAFLVIGTLSVLHCMRRCVILLTVLPSFMMIRAIGDEEVHLYLQNSVKVLFTDPIQLFLFEDRDSSWYCNHLSAVLKGGPT